jgi:iron complex outermembrane receptor protein
MGGENNPSIALPFNSFPIPQVVEEHTNVSGGYIQSNWNHIFSPRSDTALNLSYDTYERNDILPEDRKTVTLDFQHHIQWGDRQNIIWGLAYRFSTSHSQGNFSHSFSPAFARDPLFSSFVQDEFALVPDRLYLTVGTKVERNSYTGWAAMPSARLAWQASKRNMFWAAFSSPIRTPHETDVAIRGVLPAPAGPGGIPSVISLTGNPAFQNEKLNAYEAGYRTTISDKFSIDLAAYYNVYKNVQTIEPGVPVLESNPPPGYLLIPETFQNLMRGETHGLEISTNWKLFSWWSVSPSYAFELVHLRTDSASQDSISVAIEEGSSPRHSAQLRSRIELPFGVEWNSTAYFIDRLTAGNIPAYTRLDTQVSWNWRDRGSISLVGQNLLSDHHFEFQDFTQTILANQVKRSGYVQLRWMF